MAGRRSSGGGFGKKTAASSDAGSRDGFPKNRFSLELADVLLPAPWVFPLNKPNVTVGMCGGNNDWYIPLNAMGLEGPLRQTARRFPKNQRKRPLLRLNHCSTNENWHVDVQFLMMEGSVLDKLRAEGKDPSLLKPGSSVWVAPTMSSSGTLYEGPGSFVLTLVDKEHPSSSDQPVDRLTALPEVPLGIIASFMAPGDCLNSLCQLDAAIPRKLCTVGAEWERLALLPFQRSNDDNVVRSLLDCLRVATLMSNVSQLKYLQLGSDQLVESTKAGAFTSEFFQRIEKFVFANRLEELHISSIWMKHISNPLPSSLKKLVIHHANNGDNNFPHCSSFWAKVAQLPFSSASTNIHLVFDGYPTTCLPCSHDESKRTDVLPLPLVTSVSGWPFCLCRTCVVPVERMENLVNLDLNLTTCHQRGFELVYERLISSLSRSYMPQLRTASFSTGDFEFMPELLNSLRDAAPGLETVEWTGEVEWAVMNYNVTVMRCLHESVEDLGGFPSLRRLKIGFSPCLEDGLKSVLEFCLALPRSLAVIEVENLKCHNVAEKGVREVANQLTAKGKEVKLSPVDPSVSLDNIVFPIDSHSMYRYNLVVR